MSSRQTLLLRGQGIVVDLSGIAAKDAEVALVGTPTTLMGSGRFSADSLIGVTWTLKAGVAPIPVPSGHRPIFPKVAPSSSGWDIVFFEAAQRMPGGTLAGATLWSGHFDGTWTSIKRIAEFSQVSVYAGFSSELVSRDGTLGFLLNFEADTAERSSPRTGFFLITRTRSGIWSKMAVPARTGPGFVTLSAGASDPSPFLIGVVEPPLLENRFRAPSLGLRLGPKDSPVWFGDGRVPVHRASSVLIGNHFIAAWTTSADRQTVVYATAQTSRPDVTRSRQLSLPVADGPRLIGFSNGATLFGLDTAAAHTIRTWWLGVDGPAALGDSVVFSGSVFKYSIAKSAGGLLYIAALQVPSLGMSGDPSMEIVSATMRCGSPDTSKSTQTRR